MANNGKRDVPEHPGVEDLNGLSMGDTSGLDEARADLIEDADGMAPTVDSARLLADQWCRDVAFWLLENWHGIDRYVRDLSNDFSHDGLVEAGRQAIYEFSEHGDYAWKVPLRRVVPEGLGIIHGTLGAARLLKHEEFEDTFAEAFADRFEELYADVVDHEQSAQPTC